jgi:hypothetical protein
MAMKSNENDTNAAYDNALDNDLTTGELAALFQQNLSDERRHRRWIEDQLSAMRSDQRRLREQQRPV